MINIENFFISSWILNCLLMFNFNFLENENLNKIIFFYIFCLFSSIESFFLSIIHLYLVLMEIQFLIQFSRKWISNIKILLFSYDLFSIYAEEHSIHWLYHFVYKNITNCTKSLITKTLLVAKWYFELRILVDIIYTRSIGRLDKNLCLIFICKNTNIIIYMKIQML